MTITITDEFEKYSDDPTKFHYIWTDNESSHSTGFKSLKDLFKEIKLDIKRSRFNVCDKCMDIIYGGNMYPLETKLKCSIERNKCEAIKRHERFFKKNKE